MSVTVHSSHAPSRAQRMLKLPPPGLVRAVPVSADSSRPAAQRRVTDDELAEIVRSRLHHALPVLAAAVEVEASQGRVVLRGAVASPFERSLLLQTVERVAEVKGVDNRICVQPASAAVARRHRSPRRVTIALSLAAVAGLLVGIGWRHAANGSAPEAGVPAAIVTVNHKKHPASGAFIRLYAPNATAGGALRAGRVGPQGTVDWASNPQPLPPGELIVTAVWSRPVRDQQGTRIGPNVLPEEWADPLTSPLRLTISPSGTAELSLDR